MSLARGEDPVQEGLAAASTEVESLTVVVAIAPSVEERVRVAQLVNGYLPVLLVSSREEAVALLTGAEPPPHEWPVPASAMVEPLPTHRATVTVPDEASGLDIDSDWRVARWGDNTVPLSPLEHDLLRCLLGEIGHTLTFEQLHRHVWGNDHLGGRSDLQSVVKRLRRKLRDLDSPLQIHAVRGVGLRMTDARNLPETAVLPEAEPLPETVVLSDAMALPAPRTTELDDLLA